MTPGALDVIHAKIDEEKEEYEYYQEQMSSMMEHCLTSLLPLVLWFGEGNSGKDSCITFRRVPVICISLLCTVFQDQAACWLDEKLDIS